jgi:monofunctional biosynthetic peptidoglycan transglycosylase
MFGLFRRKRSKKPGRLARLPRTLRWTLRIVLVLVALDMFYLLHIWPDWDAFAQGPVAKSNFILAYEQRRQAQPELPPLQWRPVPMSRIPPHMQRAVIIGEDARFYWHSGFDLIAFREAMDWNIENRRLKYGASTLSQQTVKNMFFSGSRDPLRKWHELVFTFGMEFNVSKDRILETYLNVAEFGPGIYGVEAAARHYWGIPAAQLSVGQAVELAASLPSPRLHNPQTRTPRFLRRAERIYGFMVPRE